MFRSPFPGQTPVLFLFYFYQVKFSDKPLRYFLTFWECSGGELIKDEKLLYPWNIKALGDFVSLQKQSNPFLLVSMFVLTDSQSRHIKKAQKQEALILLEKMSDIEEKEKEGESREFGAGRYTGWWMNMERGDTSFADSWWKKALNMLKLDRGTQTHSSASITFLLQVGLCLLKLSLVILHLSCLLLTYKEVRQNNNPFKSKSCDRCKPEAQMCVWKHSGFTLVVEVDTWKLWWMKSFLYRRCFF